ncbi:MAG: sulfotransferase family protein [Rhodobacteraceae bacterium]|nr:sulfotransferase family protein [Paracoccaceae bacterium]
MAKKTPAPPPLRSALIVLGMHRSGTSALAGTLAKMGADLPLDLMEPAEQNAKGFFESNRITGLNEDLLASAGKTFFSYDPVSPDWFTSPKAMEFEERALEALAEDYGRSYLFVVKDPRICRLLPFWHHVLARAGCRALHVCTHRHPLEVAASMNRVSAYETDYAVHLWLRHVLEAEAASRGHPRVFTSYNRLMADSVDVMTQVGLGLDLKWPREPRAMSDELNGFLGKDLRNFTFETGSQRNAALPAWVQHAHEILEKWVAGGEDKEDYPRLDSLRAAVADAAPSMGQAIWQNQEKRWRLDQLQKQMAELERNLQQVRQEAASHAANHATEQRMRGAAEARIAELDQAQSVRDATEAELNSRIAAQEDRYRALADGHDALESRYDALGQTLAQVTQDRDQLCSRLEQSRTEANDLHSQALSDAQLIAELRLRLQQLEAEQVVLRRKSEHATRHMTAMTQQLSARIFRDIERRWVGDPEEANDRDASSKGSVLQDRSDEAEKWDRERQSLVSEWAEERARIDQARTAAEAQIAEMNQALEAARYEAQALQADQIKAKLAQAEIETYNRALLNSTSWRITAPLRFIVQKLRGR